MGEWANMETVGKGGGTWEWEKDGPEGEDEGYEAEGQNEKEMIPAKR